MNRLLALVGTVLVSGVTAAVTLFVLRHIGPLQRLAGLNPPANQLLPLKQIPPADGAQTIRQERRGFFSRLGGQV